MADAVVGDDVFGDDPTVNALEVRVAKLLGKEAALYVPSGTMANLLAIASHCPKRGEEVIFGDQSHNFIYEQGGASSLCGVAYNPVPTLPDGTLDLSRVRQAVKPENPHFTRA